MNNAPPAELRRDLGSPEVTLLGSVGACYIRLRFPTGEVWTTETLASLVAYLRNRQDASDVLVVAVAALGTALHCTQQYTRGIPVAIDEAATTLRGFAAMPILIRLEKCANRHTALLTPKEIAGRLVLEAGKIVREFNEKGITSLALSPVRKSTLS